MLTEAILLEQNRRLREENEELKEALRQRDELYPDTPPPLPVGVPHLTRHEEVVLRALLGRIGIIPREALHFACYQDDENAPPLKMIDVWVCKLRHKLINTDIKIVTSWGRGYFIERGTAHQARLSGEVGQLISDIAA